MNKRAIIQRELSAAPRMMLTGARAFAQTFGRIFSVTNVTALLLLGCALSLIIRPSGGATYDYIESRTGGLLNPGTMRFLFVLCGAYLIGRKVSAARFMVLTLPLLIYGGGVAGLVLYNPDASLTPAFYYVGTWLLINSYAWRHIGQGGAYGE